MSNDTNIDPTTTHPDRDDSNTRRPDPESTDQAYTDPDSTDSQYTDTDCTGAPVVPDLRGDADQRESIAETVWSHRTTEPNDE